MQITFAEALTVATATGNTTANSASLTNITTTNFNIGAAISGTGIPANTFISAIATAGTSSNGTLTLSNNATAAGTGVTFSAGARIFVVYLGKQLLTPSTTEDATVPLVEHFNGNTTAYSLVRTPPNQSSILVFVDGVFQRGSGNAYTLSGSTITFTGTTPAGTNNVTVHYVATQNNSVPTVADASITNAKLSLDYTDATYRAPTIDNSFAAATKTIKQISTTRYYNVNDVLVILNGICLIPTTDYTISTTTLTLVEGAPATASSLVVRYLAL